MSKIKYKMFITFGLIALIAAGCTNNSPAYNTQQQTPASQTPAPAPAPSGY